VQVSKNPVIGKAITGKFLGLLGTRRRDVAEYTLRTSPSARLIGLTKIENVPEKTKHFHPKVFYFFSTKQIQPIDILLTFASCKRGKSPRPCKEEKKFEKTFLKTCTVQNFSLSLHQVS